MNENSNTPKTKLRCDVCGKRFRKGGTRYRINLEIISDFDGYIEDVSKKPEDYLEKKVKKILDETKDMSEKELEEEICLKRKWQVCVNCREKFITFLKEL
jgi:ribosomal protein L14E/L6E/L27E